MSVRTASTAARSRPWMATVAECRANRRAIPAPIPRELPVISATWPSSSPILERELLAEALFLRLLEDVCGGGSVLDPHALTLEQRDAVVGRAAAQLAPDDLVQLHRLLPAEGPALER